MGTEKGFTEERFDYTEGRENAHELIIMIGPAASGKSTLSTNWVNRGRGDIVRLNRDDLRAMLYRNVPWSGKLENLTRKVQKDAVLAALSMGKDVIVDDTNCVRRTRADWENFAKDNRLRLRLVRMDADKNECIGRDEKRGESCSTCGLSKGVKVGRGVIEKQFRDLSEIHMPAETKTPRKLTRPYFERQALLKGGFVPRLIGAPWVFVDMDGTLACHTNVRDPFDEGRVLYDTVFEVVAEWVRAIYPYYNVCILSGRKDLCGDDTCDWLTMYDIPFDRILMRYAGDNRSDTIVKKEILDEVVAVIGVENIAFFIDDRPKVVRMWRDMDPEAKHGYGRLTVFPVRGGTQHTTGCPNEVSKGYRECSLCGALENF